MAGPDFAESLRAMAAEKDRLWVAAHVQAQEERREVEEAERHHVSHLRSQLLLSLTDEQLEGREPLSPELAEAWVRVFPDRPVVGDHLATGAQMQRLAEAAERRELVGWLVSNGRTVEEAKAAIGAEYGHRAPVDVAETTIIVSGDDAASKAAAQSRADVLAALGLSPDPDPRGDVAALASIDYTDALKQAGFTPQAAEEGARRVAMEQAAGRYLGFGTVVSALRAFGGHMLLIRPHLSEAVVERVEAEESSLRGSHRPDNVGGYTLQESAATLDPAAVAAAGGSPVPVVLITPGWGSTGFYSPQVLEQAARDRVIAAGTRMFADHPSASQRQDRPERRVRDLAGVLTEDAIWNGSELVSKAQFFPPYDLQFREMAGVIGLSILGSATDITTGEAEGRRGPIVQGLARVDSVDVVTRAGRGGRILPQ